MSFLPVLAYDGANMTQIDASSILDIAMAGASATLLLLFLCIVFTPFTIVIFFMIQRTWIWICGICGWRRELFTRFIDFTIAVIIQSVIMCSSGIPPLLGTFCPDILSSLNLDNAFYNISIRIYILTLGV